MDEPLKEKYEYRPMYQGTATNTLTKVSTKKDKNNLSVDNITHAVSLNFGKLTVQNVKGDFPNFKTSTHQLLDVLILKATETNSQDVSLTLFEYMELKNKKDIRQARRQVNQDLDALYNASLTVTGERYSKNNFHDLRIIDSKGIVNNVINVTFGTAFFRLMQGYPVMDYPTQLFTFNDRDNPNSYYLMRKIAELKRINLGKPRENIISIQTLIDACPNLRAYQASQGKHKRQRIIDPFENDMVECYPTFEFDYCHSKGKRLTKQEIKRLHTDFDFFKTLYVKIEWLYYPDQTARMEKKNKSIQNAKRRKASKEKLLEESIIEKDKIRIINY